MTQGEFDLNETVHCYRIKAAKQVVTLVIQFGGQFELDDKFKGLVGSAVEFLTKEFKAS